MAHSENGRNGHTDDWTSSIRQSLIFSHSFCFSSFFISFLNSAKIFYDWTMMSQDMFLNPPHNAGQAYHDHYLRHHAHDAHADPNNNRQTNHFFRLCRLCSSFYDWRRIFLNHHHQTDHLQNLCNHAHDAHDDHDQQSTIFAITLMMFMMLTMTMIRPPSLPLCSLLMMLSMTRAAALE